MASQWRYILSIDLTDEEKNLIEKRRIRWTGQETLQLFAYGSLMWRPGFSFQGALPAKIMGYHRSFCVVSTYYRGSADWPGLVLGLDRGGACTGVLYTIDKTDGSRVLDYLHEREMVTGIYEPRWVKAVTKDKKVISALAYVVDRTHHQYTGKLAPEEVARRIGRAVGIGGSNKDYLMNTLCHLRELNIRDPRLERLAELLHHTLAHDKTSQADS